MRLAPVPRSNPSPDLGSDKLDERTKVVTSCQFQKQHILVMLFQITALQVTGAFAGEVPAGTSKFFPGQHGIGL